jgi:hypothetical protein
MTPASAPSFSANRVMARCPAARALLLAVALASAAGCTGSMNRSISPLGEQLADLTPLPDERPSPAAMPVEWQLAPPQRDRREPILVALPAAEVEVNPTGLPAVAVMVGRPVGSWAMPTIETATLLSSRSLRPAAEGAIDPLRSAAALAISPLGVILQPPWTVRMQPADRFERLPAELVPPPPRHVGSGD